MFSEFIQEIFANKILIMLIRKFYLKTVFSLCISFFKIKKYKAKKTIVVFDYCRVRDKYYFLDRLAKQCPELYIVVVDGAGKLDLSLSKNINYISPPVDVYYNKNNKVKKNNTIKRELNKKYYHDKIFEQYYQMNKEVLENVGREIITNAIHLAEFFNNLILYLFKPKVCLIWNQFHPLSRVTTSNCKGKNIAIAFLEYGLLPGTINLDLLGQMGESWIARENFFTDLSICEDDILNARKTIKYIVTHGLNRKEQPKYGKLKNLPRDKKIVLLAGHNDYSSGTLPYDHIAQKYHSPWFITSKDMFTEVLKITAQLDLYLLYKPHPLSKKDIEVGQESENHLIIDNINIYECIDVSDLVMTAFSQVSYLALLRDKPVVMLGYNQLRGKSITYEMSEKDGLKATLVDALTDGYTKEMKAKWERHVAQLLRYYLYKYDETNEVSARSIYKFSKALHIITNQKTTDYQLAIEV